MLAANSAAPLCDTFVRQSCVTVADSDLESIGCLDWRKGWELPSFIFGLKLFVGGTVMALPDLDGTSTSEFVAMRFDGFPAADSALAGRVKTCVPVRGTDSV